MAAPSLSPHADPPHLAGFLALFSRLMRPESRIYWLTLIYGIAVSALTLSVPLSVQVLIGTVVNSALLQQVYVLAAILLCLLTASGFFFALQVYLMELFERRFFARIVSEVTLHLIYADHQRMERINRAELVNRYFDIMSIQKNLPPLLTGALATVMQALVGITITSFYHPVFVAFNVTVLLLAYLVFRVFNRGAARSSVTLSTTKYNAAQWLESLARSNALFKSRRGIDYALKRSTAVREEYVAEHRRHFHFTFAQITGFLLLYAIASATLLGVGGVLVIDGRLTIGQLVAAELIFSAIFYGLGRIGYYLELYYDLYAAMTKLLQLYDLQPEPVLETASAEPSDATLEFEHVRIDHADQTFALDYRFRSGSSALLETNSSAQVTAICNLLLGYIRPAGGTISIGGIDMSDMNVHALRDIVQVVDHSTFPECAVSEYLSIAAPGISRARMREILEITGLKGNLAGAPDSLDVTLTPYGYPFSATGAIKLRTAFAIAAGAKVVVLTPQFDLLSRESRESIMQYFKDNQATTVLCFSHRRDLTLFDEYVQCGFVEQTGHAEVNDLVPTITGTNAPDSALDRLDFTVPRL